VEAEALDRRQELVQPLVVAHQAGDDRLGGHLGDVGGGEGVLRDVGQPPGDPHLVPPIGHVSSQYGAGVPWLPSCA